MVEKLEKGTETESIPECKSLFTLYGAAQLVRTCRGEAWSYSGEGKDLNNEEYGVSKAIIL